MNGIKINGYEIKRKLGEGGMAEVFYTETQLGSPAALKVLRPELSAVENLRLRFEQEAQVMAKLSHPNIRRVLDITEHDSRPVILMEYLSGQDLGAYVQERGALSPEIATALWEQAVSALQFAHSEGIIHRDVKPSNFFLTDTGSLKLLDFGIAKAADQLVQTMTGQQMGTVLYMSPEQIKDPKRVTKATDYYSLGVTFHHLLTGQPPYDITKASRFAIQTKIIQEELDLFKVPVRWRDCLSACLEKKPARRQLYKQVKKSPSNKSVVHQSDLTLIEETEEKVSEKKSLLNSQITTKPPTSIWVTLGLIALFASAVSFIYVWFIENEYQPAFIQELERNMVRVEGSTFMMGCTSEQGDDCFDDEEPTHRIELGSYQIGKYEVTQAQWEAIMGSNPSKFSDCPTCPVEQVSWDDVQDFLKKLNSLTGRRYRLPTEAEWEYAARGGNSSQGYKYSGSNTLGTVGWYGGNSGNETHPVGQKTSNELGLYDMTGNVWEWCSDWYNSDYYNSSPVRNPKGPTTGSSRVLRGGGWHFNSRFCRTSNRSSGSSGDHGDNLGFRLAAAP
ncbi:bifunctional serine/threonine-protein kinase/formylglycine-generating enzyme family protein [Phaeodactylibacter xiamenensis]|uniref:bifunctional serine/threonine-protein kinase/formylglycine-generating enzyme family protein n=1 Tax=Phaeodactylibacter xiamenensis TaxID=1524460 RepID=UPI0024A7B147|nr:bifunctional serine/threonine-protein kinase/formylglycine-generating enzyme family protein [Phaeodactylibacter xiamenensis]